MKAEPQIAILMNLLRHCCTKLLFQPKLISKALFIYFMYGNTSVVVFSHNLRLVVTQMPLVWKNVTLYSILHDMLSFP